MFSFAKLRQVKTATKRTVIIGAACFASQAAFAGPISAIPFDNCRGFSTAGGYTWESGARINNVGAGGALVGQQFNRINTTSGAVNGGCQQSTTLRWAYDPWKEEMRELRDYNRRGETAHNAWAAAAGTLGGPAGALLAAGLVIVGSSYGDVADGYNQLYNDPPRFDYESVYVYTGTSSITLPFDDSNEFLRSFNASTVRLAENLEGLLVSVERFQGAVIDGNGDALLRQFAAFDQFEQDLQQSTATFADHLATLPNYYRTLGITDELATFDGESWYQFLNEYGGSPLDFDFSNEVPVAVSEPNTLLLILFGLTPVFLRFFKETIQSRDLAAPSYR